MLTPPLPDDEEARLEELRKYAVLDTAPEAAFDDIVRLAAAICHTPTALISLIDESRQWFKARVGLDATETSREIAFCAHAILKPDELFIVPDARQDERFTDNPLVSGDPYIRFYAGVPLVTPAGNALGTLCVIDSEPHELSESHQASLAILARTVVVQLELRRVSSELKLANEQLRTMSLRDPLTGLANRRALALCLEDEVSRARRYDAPLAVLMLDLDGFKSYNDDFGHRAGDDALVCVADVLKKDNRVSDMVARYGGEEFVIVLPETTEEGAQHLAERYRARVAAANFHGRNMTVSVGLAVWHPRYERTEDFLDAADQALYVAKRGGRNRVEQAITLPH